MSTSVPEVEGWWDLPKDAKRDGFRITRFGRFRWAWQAEYSEHGGSAFSRDAAIRHAERAIRDRNARADREFQRSQRINRSVERFEVHPVRGSVTASPNETSEA